MQLRIGRVRQGVCIFASLTLLALGGGAQSNPQIVCEEQRLLPVGVANPNQGADFGIALDSRTNRLAVGAPGELIDVPDPQSDVFGGAVRIFIRDPDDPLKERWTVEARIYCASPLGGDRFGEAVSFDEGADRIAVGIPLNGSNNRGAVEIFVRNSSPIWSLEDVLLPAAGGSCPPQDNQSFGFSVGLSADRAVIGAPLRSLGGAVYFFSRSGTDWSEDSCFALGDGDDGDAELGWSVAVDGDWAAVGARNWDAGTTSGAGAVYVFNLQGSGWVQTQVLLADTPQQDASFGFSVSMDDTTLVVGEAGRNATSTDVGATYTFSRSGTSWSQTQRIDPPSPFGSIQSYQFGFSVDVDEDLLIVGKGHQSGNEAFIYYKNGSSYSLQLPIVSALTNGSQAKFGSAVSLTETTAAVGAPRDLDPINLSIVGETFVFVPPAQAIVPYGTAKQSSLAEYCMNPDGSPCDPDICVPFVDTVGVPSLASPDDFIVRGRNIVVFDNNPPNQQALAAGTLMWSLSGRNQLALCGGTNYVKAAVNLRDLTDTDLLAADIDTCHGELSVTLEELIDENPAIDLGTRINAQFRFRDPVLGVCEPSQSPFNGLTDAIEFVVCP